MEEGFGYKDINNKVEKQDYWNNIKLRIFYDNVKELIRRYNVDVVLSESQFSSISDVFAVVRLVSTCNDKACKFKAYKPTSWHKILFGYGGLNRDQSKQFTKEKIDSNFGDKFNLKTQDEYDAFALILTYVKEKGIISDINFNDFLIDKDLIKRRGK
jgi:Holliday junction resolvasome RuvABC endonuclease subunit